MKMNYDELVHKGLIKQFRVSPEQVKNRLTLAQRDIAAARAMMATDRDWAFSMAYNAVLQATRALIFAKGFRPGTGEGQHKVAVRFAEITLGETFRDEIYVFDKMRSKRHRVIYDVSGLISKREAVHAFDFAERFVEAVSTIVHDLSREMSKA